ncbi:hypothetical protein RM549_08110 [Salegentibacter sp. F188]|uniref:Water stress and hypersensitive response domain-containing protein n=1 Tax=Autumnicola patrickiae TaxID=3075591 RepID=A0ABU3E234_9FLAO|nr:hypothetical protein [Salegentibacter sp. F188]MDT0689744.1 hypothetical protein [Salegentibacter sp. F188]
MRNGKLWAVIAVIVIVAAGIWWWQSSSSGTGQGGIAQDLKPEMSIASARITDISDEKISIVTEVVLKNPFPVEFKSKSMEYEVFIDSIKVIQDIYDDPFNIKTSDSTVIELPMEILVDPMTKVQDYFEKERVDSAFYALEASATLDVPIEGEEEFSMKISDSLPTFQKMKMELKNIETNLLDSDESMDVIVSLTNPNHYPTNITNGSFSFTVRDEMELVGQMEDIHIQPGATEDITVHVKKESGSLTQSAKDFIFNQDETVFIFQFNARMHSDNKMLDNTKLNIKMTGTLAEISDAI